MRHRTLCERFSSAATFSGAVGAAVVAFSVADALSCGTPGLKDVAAGAYVGGYAWLLAGAGACMVDPWLSRSEVSQKTGDRVVQGLEAVLYAAVLGGALALNGLVNDIFCGRSVDKSTFSPAVSSGLASAKKHVLTPD